MRPKGRKDSKIEAGKGELDDELLPRRGQPVPQESSGGETPDTAGEHGPMSPGTAKSLHEPDEDES